MSVRLGVKQANLAVTIFTASDVLIFQGYGFARRAEVSS